MASTTLPLIVRPTSDDALARRIAEGDEAAFALLYQRYRSRIERYCRSIVHHDEDALDAAQNTLVKALVAIRAGRQAPTVVPWLFHIARNEAITVLRGRKPQSELLESLADHRGEPAGQAMLREELAATVESVRALSDRSREALILREVAGLRYDQVAAALGVSSGAARQAVHEARRSLLADREGRDEACDVIRAALEERDGRRRNTRTVRAHLRCCGACRAWRDDHMAITSRRLAFLPGAQVSAAGGLSSWLAGVLGSGATGGAAVTGLGINAKVLASVAVVALSVTPAAEHEIAKPITHPAPAPVHHARRAAPAAVSHSAARPVAAVARPVQRVAVHRRDVVFTRHTARPRAAAAPQPREQPTHHTGRQSGWDQGQQQPQQSGDGASQPRNDSGDGGYRGDGYGGRRDGGYRQPAPQQPTQPQPQPQQQLAPAPAPVPAPAQPAATP